MRGKLLTVLLLLSCECALAFGAPFSEAEYFYRSGDIDNAILRATGVVLEAESKRDTTTLLKAWSILGMCYAERGDVLQVAKFTNLCCESLGHYGEDFHFVTSSLYSIARIYRRSNQPEEALKYLEMSMVYEVQLNRPPILAQRYLELAGVYSDMGNWEKSLGVTNSALSFYGEDQNTFILGRLYYTKGVAEQHLGDDEAALASFRKARAIAYRKLGTDTKMLPDCLIKLAEYALQQDKKDSALYFYDKALMSAKLIDRYDAMCDAYSGLAEVEDDPELKMDYLHMADSLSFSRYITEFTCKAAMSLIDFPRKEQEQRIKTQKNIVVSLSFLAVLVLLLAASLTYNVRHFRVKAELEREKNEALAESNLQKDRLLALASAAVDERELREIKKMAEKIGDPADLKLTKREREVAQYAADGLQNKEIAEKLGINTRTVEAHRNSLYRKLGINNAVELSNYMNRVKKLSENNAKES